eukprot:994567-Amphidinium_carterae.1
MPQNGETYKNGKRPKAGPNGLLGCREFMLTKLTNFTTLQVSAYRARCLSVLQSVKTRGLCEFQS